MEKLSKTARQLLILCIVGVVGLMAIIMAASSVQTQTRNEQDELERLLSTLSTNGVNATAVSLADIYGEQYQVAAVICPYTTPEQAAKTYGVPAEDLNLGEGPVPENVNYVLMGTSEGTVETRKYNRQQLDLCGGGQAAQPFSTQALIPLAKNEQGAWTLLS